MNLQTATRICYPLRDPVDADLNRYLRRQDAEDARANWIEERTEELLAGDYAPFLPENVAEAMGEMSKEDMAAYALTLKLEAYSAACTFQVILLKAYWLKLATAKAENEYDEGDEE